MAIGLIRKSQLAPDISDLVGAYGSGYFVTLANISSVLNTLALSDRSWEETLPTGFDTYYVPYNGGVFPSVPVINVTLEVPDTGIYIYNIQNSTTNGFNVLFSAPIMSSGTVLNVRSSIANMPVSGVTRDDRYWCTGLPSGYDTYYIPYSGGAFVGKPQVELTVEVTGSNIYGCNISKRDTNGFYALFSNIVIESGVSLNLRATY